MSIFDQMKNRAEAAARSAVSNLGNKRETFTFQTLPESVEQMRALPEAAMDTPFKTAALTVCALCAFATDQAVGTDLLNFLRGPRPLTGQDISFIKDRFRGGARSYIACGGADSPRPVKLRKKGDGQWCLWEQYLLTDIRQPKANDPWA